MKMSATPPRYDAPPPTLGQHTAEVLGELLGMSEAEVGALRGRGLV
jgi:formyl-CoA transferase